MGIDDAPLPAQPIEGAKSLLQFLVTQNNLKRIIEGEEGLIYSAPFDAMYECLGNQPSLETVVELLEAALKIIGEHAEQVIESEEMERLRKPKMERVGRIVEYIVTELSKRVTVYKSHPEHTIELPLTKDLPDFFMAVKKPASVEPFTGKPLAKLIAAELQGKLSTIVKDPESRFARELAKRLQRLAAS